MIINDKSVSGIFIYTDNSSQLEFEKNDFVVSGDCIYVCTAEHPTNLTYNTVSGIDPKNDITNQNYKPYPGDRVLTADEFFDYIESGSEIEDKYISSQALIGILKKYQFGMGMTGVIEDYIEEGKTSIDGLTVGEKPLDDLLFSEDLNNGVVLISPHLSQIVNGETSDGVKFSVLFGLLDKTFQGEDKPVDYSLILRQYTYTKEITLTNLIKVRVQELTSPLSGVTVYRWITWPGDEFPTTKNNSSSDWKNAYTYKSGVNERVTAIVDYYERVSEEYRNKLNQLRNSFRFKLVYEGELLDPGKVYTITANLTKIKDVDGFATSFLISDSMVIKTPNLSSFQVDSQNIYFSDESSYLVLRKIGNKFEISSPDSSKIEITDIYCREYYG